MTTTPSGRQKTSACDGVTTTFSNPSLGTASDLEVYLLNSSTDVNSAGTQLGEGTDYTVAADLSAITTTIAYPAGKYIRRWRQTTRAQDVVIKANEGVPAATQEGALDRLSRVDEEQDDDITSLTTRAFLAPVGENGGTVPSVSARAGQYAFWDVDGNLIGVVAMSSADAAALATLAAVTGAALIGVATGGSLQAQLDKINTKDEGILPASDSYTPFIISKTATANASGTSDWRSIVLVANLIGTHGALQFNGENTQLNALHSAGTLSFMIQRQGYLALGAPSTLTTTGDVSNAQWMQGHISHTGTGHMGFGAVYSSLGPDLDVGTGTMDLFHAFHSDDLSGGNNSNRFTDSSIGFFQANSGLSNKLLAGFRSQMSSGANRWTFYHDGGADSAMIGALAIGKLTNPTEKLDVHGNIVADGNIRSTGGRIGYGAGAGGAAVQLTNKGTGVINNKVTGQITLVNSALAAGAIVTFTLSNSFITPDSEVRVWVKSGFAAPASYRVSSEGNASGSRTIIVENKTAGSLSEAIVLGFNVVEGQIA